MPRESLDVGGVRRTLLHLPPADPDPSAPLLVALHGTSQQGATLRRFSGRTFDALAHRIGADLVYPDGIGRAWNDARRTRTSRAQREGVDDVGFVRAIVERFDRPAIAVGYSNGGQLVHRLLHESHGLLVGAASIAAGLSVDEDFTLVGVAPDRVPVLVMHGTGDPVVPYAGGVTRMLGRTRGTVRSAAETAEHYAPAGPPTITTTGGIERADWTAAGGKDVRLVTQRDVGHVVPNRITSPARLFVGPSHHDLDAGEELAAFFGLRRSTP
jgi:polyhydroxybutyrate depolymerase